MKRLLLTISLTTLFVTVLDFSICNAQSDVIASAKKAISSGNADGLSSYFNELVELNIDDEKSSYSKTQAAFVLKEFFEKHPPIAGESFKYIHQGASKEGLQYAIGKYSSQSGSFRVYMLIKELNGKFIIDTLDFGEE